MVQALRRVLVQSTMMLWLSLETSWGWGVAWGVEVEGFYVSMDCLQREIDIIF